MNRKKSKQVWGGRMKSGPSMTNVFYCAGRDPFPRIAADELLIPYDIWVNKVHCLMLLKQEIIDLETARGILGALEQISVNYRNGEFKIEKEKEDVHITIESAIAEIAGETISGQLHTGRSRNDQTTTDCRLFIRDRIIEFYSRVLTLMESLLDKASKHLKTAMPGFTHYQPAALTTFGHFLLSHAEAIMRDLTRIGMTYEQWNMSPLGAAAAFGTSWPLDRLFSAKYLGFNSIQENSLDCITNRWEFEAQITNNISIFMNHLSILSQDIIFLSLSPRPMIDIDDEYVTGSSIMPQKRNPDFAEVTRAKASVCHGLSQQLLCLAKGSLSGYNRDTQWTKYAIIDLFDEVRLAPIVFSGVISSLKINKGEMTARCGEQFITAVDVADYIAQEKGLPFRSAYKIISEVILECEKEGKLDLNILNNRLMQLGMKNPKLRKSEWAMLTSPKQLVERKKHAGAPGISAATKNLERLRKDLKSKTSWFNQKKKEQEKTHRLLQKEIKAILK
jgi:argininosuccinate lyase